MEKPKASRPPEPLHAPGDYPDSIRHIGEITDAILKRLDAAHGQLGDAPQDAQLHFTFPGSNAMADRMVPRFIEQKPPAEVTRPRPGDEILNFDTRYTVEKLMEIRGATHVVVHKKNTFGPYYAVPLTDIAFYLGDSPNENLLWKLRIGKPRITEYGQTSI